MFFKSSLNPVFFSWIKNLSSDFWKNNKVRQWTIGLCFRGLFQLVLSLNRRSQGSQRSPKRVREREREREREGGRGRERDREALRGRFRLLLFFSG